MSDHKSMHTTDANDETSSPDKATHLENGTPDQSVEISYDNKGISGIIRSPYVFGAALLASFGGFSFGYDQGVISLILTMPQFRGRFPEVSPEHPSYGFNTGFMTGMLELGAFVGCLFFPMFADKYSRKWGLAVATTIFTIGAIIQTAANNYGALVAGRTIGGIGVGTLAMGAPLYISEVAPPNLRGSLLVLEFISIVVGAIVAYWITYGTREISGTWSFRLPFLLQIAPALVVGLGIQLFPFSPRWLAMKHRSEDCLRSLETLRRLPGTDERVQAEWRGILKEVEMQELALDREHGLNTNFAVLELKQWGDIFKPKYLRRTVVALGMPFFQQFSGEYTLSSTTTTIAKLTFRRRHQRLCLLRSHLLRRPRARLRDVSDPQRHGQRLPVRRRHPDLPLPRQNGPPQARYLRRNCHGHSAHNHGWYREQVRQQMGR